MPPPHRPIAPLDPGTSYGESSIYSYDPTVHHDRPPSPDKTLFGGGKSDAGQTYLTSISRRFAPDGTPINPDGTPRMPKLIVSRPNGSERNLGTSYLNGSRRCSGGTGITGKSYRTYKTGYSGLSGSSMRSKGTYSEATSYLDDDRDTLYSARTKSGRGYAQSAKSSKYGGSLRSKVTDRSKPSGHYYRSELGRGSDLASTPGSDDGTEISYGASELTARTGDTRRTGGTSKPAGRSNYSQQTSASPQKLFLSNSDFNVASHSGAPSSFHIPPSSALIASKGASAFSKSGKKGKSDYSGLSTDRRPLKLSPDNLAYLTEEGSEAVTSLFVPPESSAPPGLQANPNLKNFMKPRLTAIDERSEPETAVSTKQSRRRTAVRGNYPRR